MLKDRIIDAAANRLVFLVGLEAGQVGFEIRSLQEYMAAEAIMTGKQDNIQERLRRFASASTKPRIITCSNCSDNCRMRSGWSNRR